jgi:hypothetical protein
MLQAQTVLRRKHTSLYLRLLTSSGTLWNSNVLMVALPSGGRTWNSKRHVPLDLTHLYIRYERRVYNMRQIYSNPTDSQQKLNRIYKVLHFDEIKFLVSVA